MTERKKIPFLDLVTPHHELKTELQGVFDTVLGSAGFIGGPMVEAFEREFATFCGVSECVGVGSGTDALRFALMAAGIGQGDVVVTVPNTFIATAEAISQTGARPVFVDVDEQTYNMDPLKLEEFLNGQCEANGKGELVHRNSGLRVTAVVPVHLYGQMADMDAILELTERYGLTLIEDACQAHGAEYFSRKSNGWKRSGTIGLAAAFSFYPGKNLGACGEGGAVTTNDPVLSRKIRMIRDHGQAKKYYHDIEGYNGRLDAIQAGFLSVKLRRLNEWNESRRASANRYRELFGVDLQGVCVPYEPGWTKAVYHLFVVRVPERDAMQKYLGDQGIGTAIHYPIPLHLQNAYTALGYGRGAFPVAERVSEEILSLPMFPGLQEEQLRRIVAGVTEFIEARSAQAIAAAASGD